MAAVATLAGVLAVMVLLDGGHPGSWVAGLAAGAACGLAGRRLALPRRRARSLDAPERRTACALESLRDSGWTVLHELRGRDGTYDHVAVGPGGVVLMQSIDPEGTVTLHAGEPFVQRPAVLAREPNSVRLRPRALSDAGALRDEVLQVAGQRLWVQAVVVLWSEFPAGVVADGRCAYVHGSRLADWLARRPHQLADADSEAVIAAIALTAQIDGDVPLPVAV
ncbi:MAG: nuclease-related domain-containing protein [Solirubrobacteraceae bacterium]